MNVCKRPNVFLSVHSCHLLYLLYGTHDWRRSSKYYLNIQLSCLLCHSQAYQQLAHFRAYLIPLFAVVPAQLADWRVAAKLWSDARRRGRQLSDVDVLLAAMTLRLNGLLITDDGDFAYLPLVKTENWLVNGNDSS